MHTLLYLKWRTNRDLPYSTGNSAQGYVAAWLGGDGSLDGRGWQPGWEGSVGEKRIWLSRFAMHLKL